MPETKGGSKCSQQAAQYHDKLMQSKAVLSFSKLKDNNRTCIPNALGDLIAMSNAK